ncbi:MAG TPA: YMGG-like glycine zipper-containing protein [Blastocatellia bacterium]|nr:YMGG-like glycine zipper-containing protein [Blastocatellia bacterium]
MKRIKKLLSLALVMMLAGATTAWAQTQRPYSTDDRSVEQLIRRIETRADNFRTSLGSALDNSRLDNTRREDNINQLVSDFDQATNRLRDRFNAGQSTSSDVQAVLDRAARIDRFMQRNGVATPTAERQWSLLRDDLSALANYYNVAWNWSDVPRNDFPRNNDSPRDTVGVNDRWTGTFRLNPSQSDDARVAIERAVANLPSAQRQQAYNMLLARVEAPEMIALERQGRTITLASSRAAQTTFEADGREHVEQSPNSNRTSRVRATLNRGQFTIESTGNRATDFSVSFDPVNNGNRLRVTRKLYSDRLAQPVIVQSMYDRVSDVAQWDLNNGTPPGYSDVGRATDGFIIPDGASLVTRLDTDLDTDRTRAGDRFTLTVLSPSQYEGAKIEGVVGTIDRGGRITGRTEMALNLNQIRMPDGRTYSFEGVIENVRTVNGEEIKLDTEGRVREDDSQTERTVKRGAIGAAVGAIIGAIAGGGKGAAIGAVLGGGAGAGSVYVQGRNDLELLSGTEMTIRAIAPRPIR